MSLLRFRALLLWLAMLLAGAGCKPSSPPPAAQATPRTPVQIEAWLYPAAKLLSSTEGSSFSAGKTGEQKPLVLGPSLRSATTTDPIEKVWGRYARLTGITNEFKPGSTFSESKFNTRIPPDSVSGSLGNIFYYTGDLEHSSVSSATIVAQSSGYTVAVTMVQVQGEDRTDINLVVVPHP